MKLDKLLSEDDAVSPVIGVILMVAITVILAAVIASFVLGLGDTADEVQPNTSFNIDYDAVDNNSWEDAQAAGDVDEDDLDYAGGVDFSQAEWDDNVPESDGNGLLTISVSDGEQIDVDTLFLRGDGLLDEDAEFADGDEIVVSDELDTVDELSAGQGFTIAVTSDFSVDVIWEAVDSDDSATLANRDGPDA